MPPSGYKPRVDMFSPPAWMTSLGPQPNLQREIQERQQTDVNAARVDAANREMEYAQQLAAAMQQQQGSPIDMDGMIKMGLEKAMQTGNADRVMQNLRLQDSLRGRELYEQQVNRPQIRSVPGVGLVEVAPGQDPRVLMRSQSRGGGKPKEAKLKRFYNQAGESALFPDNNEGILAADAAGFRSNKEVDPIQRKIMEKLQGNLGGASPTPAPQPTPQGTNPQARAAELKAQGLGASEIKARLIKEFG